MGADLSSPDINHVFLEFLKYHNSENQGILVIEHKCWSLLKRFGFENCHTRMMLNRSKMILREINQFHLKAICLEQFHESDASKQFYQFIKTILSH